MQLHQFTTCCLVAIVPLIGQEVLLEQATANYYQKAILVPEKAFVEPELMSLAREFLKQRPRPLLARLLMVTAEEGALVLGAPASHRGYTSWVLSYFGGEWRSWGMAEVLRIRKNAVLRIRYPDGRLARRVLQGRDPLRMFRSPASAEIVFVALWPLVGGGTTSRPPEFFVVTSMPLNQETCHRVVTAVRKATGLPRGEVAIGNDPWFIAHPAMPARYQFWDEWLPPDAVEFIESQTALTGWEPGKRDQQCIIMYPTRPPKYCESVMHEERQ